MGAADSALMDPPVAVAGHVRDAGTRRVGGRGGRTWTRCTSLRGTEQGQVGILPRGRNHVNDIRRRRARPMCEIRVLAFNRDRAMRGDQGSRPAPPLASQRFTITLGQTCGPSWRVQIRTMGGAACSCGRSTGWESASTASRARAPHRRRRGCPGPGGGPAPGARRGATPGRRAAHPGRPRPAPARWCAPVGRG